MRKHSLILSMAMLVSNIIFGQMQRIKMQLPGDAAFKDYFVNQVGDKFLLNGDIVIPVMPSSRQSGVLRTYQSGQVNKPTGPSIMSSTADDKHFAFWTVKSYKWPEGRIPVEIDPSVYDTKSCQVVKDALDYMNANSCLIFYPRSNEDDYVSIFISGGAANGAGGNSPVGKQGGKQTITLFAGQFDKFTLSHELMHSAGVYHEQSRGDRDNYISVDISRVIDGQAHNFQIEGNSTSHGSFDYCSIMQYPAAAFSIDPSKPVITCRTNGVAAACPLCMGQQSGLTSSDIKGLSDYYGQIGVSRFGAGGSFPMPCGEQYDITQQIIKVSREPDIFSYTGGVADQVLANPSNGNASDGGGYILAGKQNRSYFYCPLQSRIITENGGAIRERYEREGAEHGGLGWPEINQTSLQGGAFQRFNHGHIYWTTKYGAFVVRGPIFDVWGKTGWERGPLGWPQSEVVLLPGGAFQRFERAPIYWTAKYGAFAVKGEILGAWAKENFEKGPLGYPVSDLLLQGQGGGNQGQGGNKGGNAVDASGVQKFEHGYIEFYVKLDINRQINSQNAGTTNVHIYTKEEETAGGSDHMRPKEDLKTIDTSSSEKARYKNLPPRQTAPGAKKTGPGTARMINPQPLPPKTANIIRQ